MQELLDLFQRSCGEPAKLVFLCCFISMFRHSDTIFRSSKGHFEPMRDHGKRRGGSAMSGICRTLKYSFLFRKAKHHHYSNLLNSVQKSLRSILNAQIHNLQSIKQYAQEYQISLGGGN